MYETDADRRDCQQGIKDIKTNLMNTYILKDIDFCGLQAVGNETHDSVCQSHTGLKQGYNIH